MSTAGRSSSRTGLDKRRGPSQCKSIQGIAYHYRQVSMSCLQATAGAAATEESRNIMINGFGAPKAWEQYIYTGNYFGTDEKRV